MLAIGPMVIAAPAPKPAAVMPAARPRRPGNHFSALPTQVPYTQPVPMPPIAAATVQHAAASSRQELIDPGDGHQEAAAHDHPARAEPVDEIALDRNQPGLDQHEQS